MLVHVVRDIEKREVEKMLSCKDESRGFFTYYCKKCDYYVNVYFGCNSRICSCCGKRHVDKWSVNIALKVFKGIVHKHIVMSVPDALWGIIRENRYLQKILMEASYRTIKKLFSKYVGKTVIPGVINVVHPFGRDIGFKPHVHNIVTEGGWLGKEFISVIIEKSIPYKAFHKTWQYEVLTALRKELPKENDWLIDLMFRKYPEGFYVYVKPERIKSGKHLARYIARYVRHPAIANSRIVDYDGKHVKFWYEDNNKVRHYVTMNVDEFITAVIQHIPDPNFKMIRYFGAYSRKIRRELKIDTNYQTSIRQSIIKEFDKKVVVYCPKCNEEMECVGYTCKKPPPNLNKLDYWIELSS